MTDAARSTPFALIAAAIVLIGIACHVHRLGAPALAGTEPHRALAAHNMLQSGDYVVPTLYGKDYLAKPPMHYWQLSVAQRIGGANAWAWRMPTALWTIGFAVFAAWMGRRWFGSPADLATGLAFIALLPVWSQSRTAEIDGSNTAAAGIAALAMLELGFGEAKRRWAWALLLTLAVAALSLLKGPAGLLPVAAVCLGGSIAVRRWRWLLRPTTWLPIVVGVSALGAWAWLVSRSVTDLASDNRAGSEELVGRIAFWENPAILLHLVVTPATLLAYALPLSAAFVFVWRTRSATFDRPIVRAAAGAFAVALVLCGVALLERPRYGYVVLPLACPLAGAIIAAWRRGELSEPAQNVARLIAAVWTISLAVVAVVLLVMMRDQPDPSWIKWGALTGLAALGATGAIRFWDEKDPQLARGAATLVVVTVIATMMHADYQVARNEQRSARAAAPLLVELVGADTTVVAEKMVMYRPDLFLYSELGVRRPTGPTIAGDWDSLRGSWIVFHDFEWKTLDESHKAQLESVTPLPEPTEATVAYLP